MRDTEFSRFARERSAIPAFSRRNNITNYRG